MRRFPGSPEEAVTLLKIMVQGLPHPDARQQMMSCIMVLEEEIERQKKVIHNLLPPKDAEP